jgi:GrpB-like predicted nucleotidyltransferase (UPF0157 family)
MTHMRVRVVPYDEAWPVRFQTLAGPLRDALGARAVRVEHIGSTSVPGLGAKPIVDVQVSLRSLEPFEPVRQAIEALGYDWLPDNDDRRKRYFRRRGEVDVNIHVRTAGEFSEQAALVLRDYLRASPSARGRYEAVKRSLAEQEWETVDHYADAKGDCIWALLREADRWGGLTGWGSAGG